MVPSLACLSDNEIRRRSRSMSITLTMISSPTLATCSGISTCRSASSEMCTRPSMPSSTRTNAPNGTNLVTLPGTTWPMAWVRANCRQGVLLGRLERQRDPLAVEVHIQHLDVDLLADLDRERVS